MDEAVAFWNGSIVPYKEAALPLHDAGFTMGATVSDVCRTFRHQVYRWEDHLKRFRQSCEAAFIPLPLSDKDVTEFARQVVDHNAALCKPEAELMLILVATPGSIGSDMHKATLGIHTLVLPYERYQSLFQEGANLITPPTVQVPASSIPAHIKQRSRFHYWMANEQAHRLDGDSALLLDGEGNITETSIANFLLVKDGTVISPPRSTILEGISLMVVRELCGVLSIPFVEKTLTLRDCRPDDEALLTGTAFCIAGVRSINGRAMRWPGPVFEKLLAAWSAKVGVDIRAQFA